MAPPRGRGRPKGVPNRITTTVKRAIEAAYEGSGGIEAFTEWARQNPGEFYKLWVKLLPVDIRADLRHEGAITIMVETGVPRAPDDRLGGYVAGEVSNSP